MKITVGHFVNEFVRFLMTMYKIVNFEKSTIFESASPQRAKLI